MTSHAQQWHLFTSRIVLNLHQAIGLFTKLRGSCLRSRLDRNLVHAWVHHGRCPPSEEHAAAAPDSIYAEVRAAGRAPAPLTSMDALHCPCAQ